MMVGRNVNFHVEKKPAEPGDVVLEVKNMTMASKVHKNNAVKNVSFQVRRGEIVCIAGIDGNGQTELVYGLTGLEPLVSGELSLCGQDITHTSIRKRSTMGMSHIPEDRHKHGLVLDYSLEDNMILQRYFEPEFTDKAGFLRRKNIRGYAERLIEQYDVRSGQGPVTIARSMSGGNQQKAIVAREIDKDPELLVAVQPTRGLDVGAIEYIHRQLVAQRDEDFHNLVANSGNSLSAFCDPRMTTMIGSAPLRDASGELIGAIAVSGWKSEEDQELADAAAKLI